MTEPTDAGFVAKRLYKSLAQTDAHILDRMMIIDMQVTLACKSHIKACMFCQGRQHMIKKTRYWSDRLILRFRPDSR